MKGEQSPSVANVELSSLALFTTLVTLLRRGMIKLGKQKRVVLTLSKLMFFGTLMSLFLVSMIFLATWILSGFLKPFKMKRFIFFFVWGHMFVPNGIMGFPTWLHYIPRIELQDENTWFM
ncbi:hypothetical protein Ccrd_024816, partial [Cynara cardunculus var. scolymus]